MPQNGFGHLSLARRTLTLFSLTHFSCHRKPGRVYTHFDKEARRNILLDDMGRDLKILSVLRMQDKTVNQFVIVSESLGVQLFVETTH
jgi:hypothetical protein